MRKLDGMKEYTDILNKGIEDMSDEWYEANQEVLVLLKSLELLEFIDIDNDNFLIKSKHPDLWSIDDMAETVIQWIEYMAEERDK